MSIDGDDIGGVVTGPKGPEAGVWVDGRNHRPADATHQERRDRRSGTLSHPRSSEGHLQRLGARLRSGRFAEGQIHTRQAGRVDGGACAKSPGAAEYYPARYWLSLLQLPPESDFPGTGPTGNGISPTIKSQGEWIRNVINTDGCTGCHQMGNRATREIPEALGRFENFEGAWDRRIQSGQAGGGMSARFTQVGRPRALAMWADWTDRIARASCPQRRRRGRRAANGTSS